MQQTMTLFHILMAMTSFGVLCIAGFLAVLLAIQEFCLRHKKMMRLMVLLPALESMEIWLFRIILLGFILLTMLLITSFYFYHHLMFTQSYFFQKALIATLTWFLFAWLLLGRYYKGWCGRKAIYGTLFGVFLLCVLLCLSYFGSQWLMNGMH